MKGLVRSLGDAWLILVLATAFGAALASVHSGLAELIAANKRAETLRQVPGIVLGYAEVRGAEISVSGDRLAITNGSFERLLEVAESELAGHMVLEVTSGESGDLVGWVVQGSDQGYADTIELLIGLSPDAATLTGLYVLSQKETPALGDGITKQEFRDRFVGRATSVRLSAVPGSAEGAGEILALTAATVSSRSVCDIVNDTVAEVGPLLTPGGMGAASP